MGYRRTQYHSNRESNKGFMYTKKSSENVLVEFGFWEGVVFNLTFMELFIVGNGRYTDGIGVLNVKFPNGRSSLVKGSTYCPGADQDQNVYIRKH